MDVEVQLDRTTLTVRQILDLAPESLILLHRSAAQHIDLLIGGALVARGDIVPFKDRAAIRISELREEA
jgi:flagellar motor switch protein FliN